MKTLTLFNAYAKALDEIVSLNLGRAYTDDYIARRAINHRIIRRERLRMKIEDAIRARLTPPAPKCEVQS